MSDVPDEYKPRQLRGPDPYWHNDGDEAEIIPPTTHLTEEHLKDKLRDLAMMVRSLTAEEIWAIEDKAKRPGLSKLLVGWAKAYMEGEEMPEIPEFNRRI